MPPAGKEKTPRAPTRARLPLLRFRPGGVGRDGATRGAAPSLGRAGPGPKTGRRFGASSGRLVRGLSAARARGARALRKQVRFFVAVPSWNRPARRIRLVAYGARLESVLGASPRGFESPILRQ